MAGRFAKEMIGMRHATCTANNTASFNVSPKKISRWRDVGLESGLFKLGGRRQVGFLQDALSLSYDYRMTAQIFQAT